MAQNEASLDLPTRYEVKSRYDFPTDFVFGTSTSAFQIEGAALKYGRGMCQWDKFCFTNPDKIKGGANASVTIDHYHRMKDDVKMLKKLGLDAYRFSISWSRILPAGRLNGGVNREGVKFYNDLIDLLRAEGIEPLVTLFHFETPLCLEDEYGGFLSSKIVQDFLDFAKVCFFEFGDRVKNWITVNEPWTYTVMGYVYGVYPPGRTSNPSKDCYTVGHNLLLAHVHAVHLYRNEFWEVQRGQMGITNMSWWFEPLDNEDKFSEDLTAARRALDFMLGWFTTPLVTGDYPPVMKQYVGNRLPAFTYEEKKLLKASFDFIGLNYYTSQYVKFSPNPENVAPYFKDQQAEFSDYRLGKDGHTKIYIGEKKGSSLMYNVPWGLRKLIVHTKAQYNNPIIYITENGLGERDNMDKTITQALDDKDTRTKFIKDHLAALKEAMDKYGARVKGYFVWSMFDNFEWSEGYTIRYGLFYVDYNDDLKRYPKNSALWYLKFLKSPRPVISPTVVEQDETTTNTPENVSNKRLRALN